MKQFLYLVQSRIKCLEDQKILESDNSDCIVATFEKKIDRENFIYVPNTIWTEGRNALYAEALKRKDDYEYFVFLDDDIVFERGNFRVFENEVLHIQADFAMPAYFTHKLVKQYDVFNPFRYSSCIFFDPAFMCMSRELFCSPKLLPFDMNYIDKPDLGGGAMAPSNTFFMKLYEYFSDKKILITNNVAYYNNLHETNYDAHVTTDYYYPALKKYYIENNPGYRDIIHKKVSGMIHLDQICKIMLRTPIMQYIPILANKHIHHRYLCIILKLTEKYILVINFIRDLKLNFRLRES